jgi:hypothetical protein
MATTAPETAAGAGDYVQPPQPQVPVEDKLHNLKIAAEGKVNEFVDKANINYNNAANNPANKASDERLKQDVDTTAQHAATSYTQALNQLGEAFNYVEATGQKAAQQLGLATNQTAANAQEVSGAAREHAQQRTEETKAQLHDGKSALQQGINKVHDALSEGAAVTTQKLQEGAHNHPTGPSTTVNEPKAFHSGETQSPSMLQSLGNVISQTAQSVKQAFVTPSPTATQPHATPTSTNLPVTHPPAQTTAESFGQTAAALKDTIKSAWSTSPREFPQPGLESAQPGMQQHTGLDNADMK